MEKNVLLEKSRSSSAKSVAEFGKGQFTVVFLFVYLDKNVNVVAE